MIVRSNEKEGRSPDHQVDEREAEVDEGAFLIRFEELKEGLGRLDWLQGFIITYIPTVHPFGDVTSTLNPQRSPLLI